MPETQTLPMQLSAHFTRADLERSDFAVRHGITNRIPDSNLEIWRQGLLELVEPLYEHFALHHPEAKLHITSAYRSEDLNRKLHGSRTSQHMGIYWRPEPKPSKWITCAAFDLELFGIEEGNRKLWNQAIVAQLPFDQLIWEFGNDRQPAWVHISKVEGSHQRNQAMRAQIITEEGKNRTLYTLLKETPGITAAA